jgi:hypothetical protein
MQIVTQCFTRDQRLLCNRNRSRFAWLKRVAHHRNRMNTRESLQAIQRGDMDADEAVFESKPMTGWEVV